MNESEIIEHFQTKGGHAVSLRLLKAEDAPFLIDIFEHMSPESRYQRFNQSVDAVPPERIMQEAQAIAQAELEKKLGVIAFADLPGEPEAPIGAARLVAIAPGQAEVALSVRDDMHSLGVGTRMLRNLACLARERGYRKLVATIRNDNPAVWHVFNRLPFEVTRIPEGSLSEIEVDLTQPRVKLTEAQTPTPS